MLASAGFKWRGERGVPMIPKRLLLSSGARCWLSNVFGLTGALNGVLGSKNSKSGSSTLSDMSRSRIKGDEYGSVAGIALNIHSLEARWSDRRALFVDFRN